VLTASLVVQLILLFATPIVVGFWLKRRLRLSWVLFLGGALSFVVAWIITILIPLPSGLGLLISSVVQMGVLYLIYRFLLSTVNTEREAFLVGAGQGGIELIILVIFLALPSFTQMLTLRDANDETLISLAARTDGISEEEVEPARIDELRESIDDYWSTPWYGPLAQAISSLTAIPIQMALAVMVLRALTQNTLRPLVSAMALFFLARNLPVIGGFWGGILAWLGLSLLFGGTAIWFLNRLWPVVREQTKTALKESRKAEKQAQRSQ
jgi:uncharacterized membrane protein YhfC